MMTLSSGDGDVVPCRLVVADDNPGIRALTRITLHDRDAIDVVAEAADGVEAIAAVLKHAPDVLLLDLRMPGVDGLEVLAHLQREEVATKVVIYSSHARERLAPLLMELGARGYVEKGAAPEVLTRAVLDACAA
jgi:DNA-binding NarL/FixJ family response regulator